ncbi:MAG: RICIN domain-containing protein [Lachnospiraceae bacterium]|nr:RICIN domain-containing protein [Lachnospiraceae bacterium]
MLKKVVNENSYKNVRKIMSIILVVIFLFEVIISSISVFAAERVNITEGCYIFASGLNNSKCLDVSGMGVDNGTNLQIWSSNKTDAQMFYVTEVNGNSGWYSIQNIYSRKALDVTEGISRSGINVQLYEWNGSDAQLWQFYNAGNGYYYIKNKLGYYLDVSGGFTADGTNVQVHEWNGTNAQKWKIVPSQGIYSLISGVSNSKCLDISGMSMDNGTNIQIWSVNNTGAQMFYINQESSGWYSIRTIASKSEKVIDVTGGVKGSGVNVQLHDWNGSDAQLWQFYDAGNGYYYIKNKLGYYLDVSGGFSKEGTNVQVHEWNGTKAQMWKLQLVDLTETIMESVLISLYKDGVFYKEDPLDKLLYYYENFNHGAKYDVKVRKCWDNLFKSITYPGSKDGSNGVILYDGQVVTPEHMGNIIYGFTGNTLGFCDKLIYQGGGYAANGANDLNNPLKYYGDSEIDHKFISIGIKKLGKTPTIDLDLSQVPSMILNLAKGLF